MCIVMYHDGVDNNPVTCDDGAFGAPKKYKTNIV